MALRIGKEDEVSCEFEAEVFEEEETGGRVKKEVTRDIPRSPGQIALRTSRNLHQAEVRQEILYPYRSRFAPSTMTGPVTPKEASFRQPISKHVRNSFQVCLIRATW